MAPRPTSSSAAITVEKISTWDELKLMAKPWARLTQDCAADDFFMSWEFAGSWWQAYQRERELFVLECRNEQNDVVGIAPLYRESDGNVGLKSRTLRLIGDGSDDADGFGFLLRPGLESECVRSILDWLATHETEWDVLQLASVAEGSRFAQELLTEVQRRGWVQRAEFAPHLTVELPSTWDQYLGSLSAKVRQTWLRKIRHAEERFTVGLRRTESIADLDADLETAMQLHNRSWRARGMAGKLESPDRRNFYVALAHAAFQTDSLDLWQFELDGVPRAARLGFRAGKTRHAMLAGMDSDFAGFSPGTIAEAMVLKKCIERGDRVYDFLAGNEEYKLECRPSEQRYLTLTVARPRTRSGIRLAAQSSVQEGKDWLRTELPSAYQFLRKTSGAARGTRSNAPVLGASKSARVSSANIRLEVFRDHDSLQALSYDWNALLSRSASDSIFLSWEWMTAWLDAYGSRELMTLAGCAPSGELVGIAPFYISPWPKPGRHSLRVLRLLGDATEDAGSLGVISKRGTERVFAEILIDWLEANRSQWDALELSLLGDNPSNGALREAFRAHSWTVRERSDLHLVIDLPRSMEEFNASLSKGRRRSLVAAKKRLATRDVGFHRCQSLGEIQIGLEHLFRLHTERWEEQGKTGAFSRIRQDFYRQMAVMSPVEKIDLWTMSIDGVTAAAELGLAQSDTLTSLQSGFDPEYARLSVATLLVERIMEAAIDRGLRRCDLLRGEHAYKKRWGARPQEYMSVRCAPPRSLGAAWVRLSGVKTAQSLWRSLKGRSVSL